MKKIVSPEMVAHLWANQSQTEASNSGRTLFFDGGSIYSYGRHFCIAKHVTNSNNQSAILWSDRSYSNTTSKHQSIVNRAIQGQRIIVVPDASDSISTNFDVFGRRIKQTAESLLKAKKPEKYINHINSIYAMAGDYALFLGIEIPNEVTELWQTVQTPAYKTLLKERAEKLKQQQIEREKKGDADAAEHLELWRNGKVQSHYHRGLSYLKLSATSETIQTSQGVFIPLDVAKQFYMTVLETIKNGGCIDCNMKFMHNYNVREITADHIIVGCHKITIAEIQRLTNSLNW